MKISHICPDSWAANCYLIISSGEAYVVDPAISADAVMQRVKEENVTLRGVILTHGHFDHILSAEHIGKSLGIPVMIHREDNEMLIDGEKNSFKQFFGLDRSFAPADCLLDDGDILPLGNETITVIHTPGHTKGGICLLCGGEFLVTGDTLFADTFGRIDLYGGDLHQMKASLRKLSKLEPTLNIYPGHGESATLGVIVSKIRFLRYFYN